MTYGGIYWGDDARLVRFSAATKGKGATSAVKIELEVTEPYRLATLLEDLARIQREQASEAAASKPKRAMPAQLDGPAAPLLLGYRGRS